MRAIICELMIHLYIDQEPRRIEIIPDLCKPLKTDSNETTDSVASQASENIVDG
jgi:hypothetical protein